MALRGAASVPDVVEFVTDAQLLGLTLSEAQETLLRAIYGLPLSEAQAACFRLCTGREQPPAGGFGEVTVVAGARAGKDSRIAAPIICYESVFGGHERHLAKGERAVLPLVAQDARATRVAFGYIRDYLVRSPLLARQVAGEPLASEITLTNGLSVACFPSTLRSLRGWTIPAGVLDELAFFRLEGSADSDAEIQASIRRGMLSFPAPRLVKISTPYMRSGVLYEDFKRAWALPDPDLLVWRAPSLVMNPSLRPERLERERRLDPSRFAREYEAEFAEDLEAFLPGAWVDGAIVRGRHELPPRLGVPYVAAVDPSGGGADAFTLVIAHHEESAAGLRVVQDVMKSWTRTRQSGVDLEGVVKEIAGCCRDYRCTTVLGDRYGSGWVRERFRAEGLRYIEPELKRPNEPDATRYLDKSLAYAEVTPLFAQGRIDLLDHPQLIRELKCLERRARAGGKPLIDHPTGGHDDCAVAVALAAVSAMRPRRRLPAGFFERPTITDVIPGEPAPPLPSPSGGIRRVEF
jgi:hypothetical protein